MFSLHIQLLGNFHALYQNTPVLIPQARVQSLLGYLALHGQTPQSRQQLSFLFWPDSSEAHARASLRKLLYDLRQVMPEINAVLAFDKGMVHWRDGTKLTVDVAAFSSLLAQAQQAADPLATRTALERALALYGGELLPACYEDWVLRQREWLHQHYLDALEQVSRLCTDQGDLSSALVYAQRLVQADPLQESAYRLLMQLHLRNGDRARALRVYHTCATLLSDELGVEPSPETQLLFQQLLNLDALPLTQPLPVPQAGVRSLVGRKREWETLLKVWQMTAQEAPRFALIAGEAGIGKSRLAHEMIVWAQEQNITALQARAYAAEGSLVYSPVIGWLRSETLRPVLAQLDPVWRSEIGRLLPEMFAQYPDLPRPEPLTEQWQRQRLFEALARAFAAATPLLLVLDDLQWCDRETLEWLHYLLRFDANAPLLVTGTMRPEEVDAQHPLTSLLLNLRSASKLSEIELGPLNAGDSAALAAQVAERELDAKAANLLYQTTEGNPLFIVETVRASVRTLGPEGEQERPASPDHFTALPSKVQAVIQARLAQLSSPAHALAHLAATIGREFTTDVLAHASGDDEETLVRGLDELWQRRIVREQGAAAYDFSHDKLRESAYNEISPARRRLLHRRVAQALEQANAADLDSVSAQLSWHYEHAGAPKRAIDFYLQAGMAARRIYANNEAIGLFAKALTLFDALSASPQRDQQELSVLLAMIAVLHTKNYVSSEASDAINRALVLSRKIDDTRSHFWLLRGLYLHYLIRGDISQSYEWTQSLLKVAEREQDPLFRMISQETAGVIAFFAGNGQAAQTHFDRAIMLRTAKRHQEQIAFEAFDNGIVGLAANAHNLWCLGHADQALRKGQSAVQLAKELVHPFSQAAALAYLATLHQLRREPADAQTHAEAALLLADRHDVSYYGAWAGIIAAWTFASSHPVQEGIAHLHYALDEFRAPGSGLRWPYYFSLLAEIYAKAGDGAAAIATLEEALDAAAAYGEHWWEAELHRLRGESLMTLGTDLLQVEAAFQRALDIARQQKALALELRAAISLSRLWQPHKRRQAYELLVQIYTRFTEGLQTHDLQEAAALLKSLS